MASTWEAPLTWNFNSFSTADLAGGLKAQKASKHPGTAEKELYNAKVCELKFNWLWWQLMFANRIIPYLTLPYLALPCLALPCLALPYLALPCLALPCLALPCLALPCLALPCLALPCLALPCLALPCLALPCLALPCLALPCLALPCLALPCLTLPYFVTQVSYVCNLMQPSLDHSHSTPFLSKSADKKSF